MIIYGHRTWLPDPARSASIRPLALRFDSTATQLHISQYEVRRYGGIVYKNNHQFPYTKVRLHRVVIGCCFYVTGALR